MVNAELARLQCERDELYRQLKDTGEKKLPANPALMKRIKRVEKKIREMRS